MVNDVNADSKQNPVVLDSEFQIEEFVSGLFVPVNMEFIGDDLLVLEKNSGTVRHIKNNALLDAPVLDVEVSNYGEQGLLGITSIENDVYLFFTIYFLQRHIMMEVVLLKIEFTNIHGMEMN
jgi:glucose/arabinose dehydrogenase